MGDSAIDISVVVPCRNEEGYIRETIRRLTHQETDGFRHEILIVDGMSGDATRNIVEEEASNDARVRLLVNEKRITPCAFNLGIRNSAGKYICILGAHAEVADDYLRSCLAVLEETNADNVGGPWKAKGRGYWGEAIALGFQSPFAVGGARSHSLGYEGPVDSVWGGFYRRAVFDRIGMFDEGFVRNQDDELNLRLTKSGGKIWQSPRIRYDYYCRNRLGLLWGQYLQYGYWKIRVIRKHRLPASVRHLVPGAFVLALILLSAGSFFSQVFLVALLAMIGAYAAVLAAGTLLACGRPHQWRFLPVLPAVLATFHLAYGFGFLWGLCDSLLRRPGSTPTLAVTR